MMNMSELDIATGTTYSAHNAVCISRMKNKSYIMALDESINIQKNLSISNDESKMQLKKKEMKLKRLIEHDAQLLNALIALEESMRLLETIREAHYLFRIDDEG